MSPRSRHWFNVQDAADNVGVPETTFRRYLADAGLKADGTCSGNPVFSIQWVRQFRAVAPLLKMAGRLAKAGNQEHAAYHRKLAVALMAGKNTPDTPAPAPALKASPTRRRAKGPLPPGVRLPSEAEMERVRAEHFRTRSKNHPSK